MRRLNERKKGETERNMMIKEEAAEDISGKEEGRGRGLPRRTVAASQRRTNKDEARARARPRWKEQEQSKGLRGGGRDGTRRDEEEEEKD